MYLDTKSTIQEIYHIIFQHFNFQIVAFISYLVHFVCSIKTDTTFYFSRYLVLSSLYELFVTQIKIQIHPSHSVIQSSIKCHVHTAERRNWIQSPKIDSIIDSLFEKEQINNFTMRRLSSHLLHLNNQGNTEGL